MLFGSLNYAIATSGTLAGTIADSGTSSSVTVADGQLTLSGSNTYTGDTTVSGGTLELTTADALASMGRWW